MEPHSGRPDGGERPSETNRDPEDQVALAEYAALRSEIERRANIQWHVLALQTTSAGAVAGLAISTASDPALLLIIPLFSYMFGSRYILHDFYIKLIQQYVRTSLSGRLRHLLEWERWKKDVLSRAARPAWFQVTNWNVAHPTRLAFEGVAALALVAAVLGSLYRWWDGDWPHWALVTGYALLWTIGAGATFLLHRSFDAASGTDAVQLPEVT